MIKSIIMVDTKDFDSFSNKIEYWKSQLRDMGRRNALLFFKLTKTSSLLITEPSAKEVFNRVVVHNRPIYAPLQEEKPKSLFDDIEIENELDEESNDGYRRKSDEFISKKTIKQLNRTLRNIMYRSRLVREEQGYNALYMGFGTLKWQEGIDSDFYEAPLVLVPVTINRDSSIDRFRIELYDDDIVLNPTLRDKLSSDFLIELGEIDEEMDDESVEEYWSQINQKVKKLTGWEVLPKVIIGIFNFQTLQLIKDLDSNIVHYQNHPIIRMLCGIASELPSDNYDIINKEELDDKVNPNTIYQILDADSSQQEAIEAAKAGKSFILEGPPGTGKSQTIANIIAESLAADKKILFVSQKSVALDVVHKRLSQRGLSEFCLEVHSYKKNKKDVINDLGKSLSAIRDDEPVQTENKKRELHRIRKELNEYVRELHKPKFGLRLSLFSIYGRLANLNNTKNLRFKIKDIEKITSERFDDQLATIRKISTYRNIIINYSSYPWKGFGSKEASIQYREEIEEKLKQLSEEINSLTSFVVILCKEFHVKQVECINDIFKILSVLFVYDSKIFTDEYKDIIHRYLTEYKKSTRYLKLKYWQDRKIIKSLQKDNNKQSVDEIIELFSKIMEISEPIINQSSYKSGIKKFSSDDEKRVIKWQESIQDLKSFAINLFKPKELPEILNNFSISPILELTNWLQMRSRETGLISPWINFRKLYDKGCDLGLDDFICKSLEEKLFPEEWENVYLKRFYKLLSDQIINSNPILQEFQSDSHSNLIERFRYLDNKIIDLAANEIRKKLYSERPDSTWVKAESAETTLLRKELNKKRRIKPLRILFSEIPNLILRLKPCLMMSPLSVCQLIDPKIYQFDIAVFDEASQIPPEYAIGTIARAKQVIIAGDRHQLPPTRFFQTFNNDDFDEDDYETEDFESILNAFDAINLPNKMLKWHYRSEDESLIAFSNFNFYDNKLLTFPNSDTSREDTGLEFHFVEDGIYRRGKGGRDNPIEAKRVAELVFEILKRDSSLSIGVVSFSQSQRQRIEHEIERLRKNSPDLNEFFDYEKSEHLFVKNLETVQGDERDVIIFSIGYGKDELGNISMNFGPLNRQGGERRLNVAVTRARKAVKLVSSIEPEDLDLSKTQSSGVRLLKEYMLVARDGIENVGKLDSVNSTAEFGSPFEEAVYDALSKRGLKLIKQVGVSNYKIDFGIIDPEKPGRYILGIECDGATYHSSPTARDRDRLRQQLLEEKFGWIIHRIWSRDWINNRSREIQKVIDAVEQSKAGCKKKELPRN
jgi:superfamily I DNA and/or RNA helicase/very-short-patch-repair endonuclease